LNLLKFTIFAIFDRGAFATIRAMFPRGRTAVARVLRERTRAQGLTPDRRGAASEKLSDKLNYRILQKPDNKIYRIN
jgi:hypothetical protein